MNMAKQVPPPVAQKVRTMYLMIAKHIELSKEIQ